jgi:hypothetical protein
MALEGGLLELFPGLFRPSHHWRPLEAHPLPPLPRHCLGLALARPPSTNHSSAPDPTGRLSLSGHPQANSSLPSPPAASCSFLLPPHRRFLTTSLVLPRFHRLFSFFSVQQHLDQSFTLSGRPSHSLLLSCLSVLLFSITTTVFIPSSNRRLDNIDDSHRRKL